MRLHQVADHFAGVLDEVGVAVTPTTIVVIIRDPAGTETTTTSPNAAITTPVTGTIKYTFPTALNLAGTWSVRMKGTGGTITAGEGTISVATSNFTSP